MLSKSWTNLNKKKKLFCQHPSQIKLETFIIIYVRFYLVYKTKILFTRIHVPLYLFILDLSKENINNLYENFKHVIIGTMTEYSILDVL